MNIVTLSPTFQVVIPQAIREALRLAPGDKFRVMRYGDRVEPIPVTTMAELRGFARGMDTTIHRDRDDTCSVPKK